MLVYFISVFNVYVFALFRFLYEYNIFIFNLCFIATFKNEITLIVLVNIKSSCRVRLNL